MTAHLGLQRILLPSAQVSQLTTGTITLPSARGAFVPDTDFQPIASTVLSTSASTITFSSIPATFKHLQVRYSLIAATADYYQVKFNGASTGYASGRAARGTSGNLIVSAEANAASIYSGLVTASSNYRTGGIMNINDYAQTDKFKTIIDFMGVAGPASGTSYVGTHSGQYRSTSAISSITFAHDFDFASGSVVSLYGIMGA